MDINNTRTGSPWTDTLTIHTDVKVYVLMGITPSGVNKNVTIGGTDMSSNISQLNMEI